ncbi:hypothetical protein UFOVP745_23 [uncultured Caudovirales phage]|uniref:Uncharacterized protein n=1 Tax=uncultured Caudovirales phage TaxID=2100421 RepID=A0A6J7XCH6_9CAUD|nr:hypothetical protein UFOVP745_23 [uncultured Caudovirales phage]
MEENKVIEAFTLKLGTRAFWDALYAVIQSEHNSALSSVLDVVNKGEDRAYYAGQVAALIDLRAIIEDYATRSLTEVEFSDP